MYNYDKPYYRAKAWHSITYALVGTVTLLFLSCACQAQDNPLDGIMPLTETGEPVYTEVVTVGGISQAELFNRAKKWVATQYRSAQDVTQLSDAATGAILIKGYLSTPHAFNGTMKMAGLLGHTMNLEIKDGRYRYTVDGFTVRIIPPAGASGWRTDYTLPEFMARKFQKKNSIKYAEQANDKVLILLDSLKKAMATGAADF